MYCSRHVGIMLSSLYVFSVWPHSLSALSFFLKLMALHEAGLSKIATIFAVYKCKILVGHWRGAALLALYETVRTHFMRTSKKTKRTSKRSVNFEVCG